MKHIKLVMMALAASTFALPALAGIETLNFDPAKLCAWQATNNGMDLAECGKFEDESKAAIPELEAKADAARKDACVTETKNFSGDSTFASYTVYVACLKDGPGSQ